MCLLHLPVTLLGAILLAEDSELPGSGFEGSGRRLPDASKALKTEHFKNSR